jgi:hypothetical protein
MVKMGENGMFGDHENSRKRCPNVGRFYRK